MVMKVAVTKKRSNHKVLFERLTQLSKIGVLVGIPQAESSRTATSGDPSEINNAELLYIHSHGVRNGKMITEMSSNMSVGAKYSDAYDLYVQSHGSALMNTPPRPVIEPAIEANMEPISAMMRKAAHRYLESGQTTDFMRVGIYAAAACKNWFEDARNNWAPNSPYTIKKKGTDKPLIDSSSMRNAITYVLDEKGEHDT